MPDSTNIVPDKSAEIFRSVGDNSSITFDDNKFDFDGCNITEVIMFLQKLAKLPNASEINMANISLMLSCMLGKKIET